MKKQTLRKHLITFFVGVFLLSNLCLSGMAQQQEDQNEVPKPTSKNQKKLPFAIRDNSPMSSTSPTNYQTVADYYEEQRTIALRNRLIFMAVSQIDIHFRTNERDVRHKNRLLQTVLSILEVGAATAISITKGERPKSIIADGLGFIQGSRDSINKNYRMLDRQILVNKMIEKRSKVLGMIYDRVGKSDEEYPFERAFIDLLDYFEAGRLDSALAELAKDSGASADKAEKDLAEAKKKADIRLLSTADQTRVSKVNSKIVQTIANTENQASKTVSEMNTKISNADNAIKKADEDITSAGNVINSAASPAEKSKANELIVKAQEDKKKAQDEKSAAENARTEAQQTQTAAMAKYKYIFKEVNKVAKLSVLFDELPSLYESKDQPEIKDRLARIRLETASANEYGLTFLKFYGRIAQFVGTDDELVESAAKILEEAEKK